jgi:hypothetical protein
MFVGCDTRMSRTKLTVEQVLEAWLHCCSGKREFSKLAREFGVSREAIRDAVDGVTFKDLPMPPKGRR